MPHGIKLMNSKETAEVDSLPVMKMKTAEIAAEVKKKLNKRSSSNFHLFLDINGNGYFGFFIYNEEKRSHWIYGFCNDLNGFMNAMDNHEEGLDRFFDFDCAADSTKECFEKIWKKDTKKLGRNGVWLNSNNRMEN